MTLKQLSEKVGYGTGNLSSYETGKLQAKDNTLRRILMRGFDMSEEEATAIIAKLRKKELEETYKGHLSLAQESEKYNEQIHKKDLVKFLEEEGYSDEEIEEVLKKLQK